MKLTKFAKQIIALLVVILMLVAASYYVLNSGAMKSGTVPGGISNTKGSEEVIKQEIEYMKGLNASPISQVTRSLFDAINSATSTKDRARILNSPQISPVKDLLTEKKLNSKFVIISGQEIPSVGAQIYIVFLNEPDMVFRLAFQLTGATSSPFALTAMNKAEDKPETIQKFLENLSPYLSDPEMSR